MIKNVIFDVGKVLMEYDPEGFLKRLGFDEKTQKAVNEAMFLNHLWWEESDRGTMTPAELLEGFVANNPAYEKEIRKAHRMVGGTIELMPYAVEWVKNLKSRGYRLYILSNYAEYTYEQTEHKMKFLPYMDGTVFSYRCKLLKPEKEIYEYICKKYNLIPAECVFIDDREENTEAARSFGMQAITFSDYETDSKNLEDLLQIQ